MRFNYFKEALAVSFDNNIGHDYIQNYNRYDYYHRKTKLNLI